MSPLPLALSILGHVILFVALVLIPLLSPGLLPAERRGSLRAVLYDPPPPAAPPLPKGFPFSSGSRTSRPVAPVPVEVEPHEFMPAIESRPPEEANPEVRSPDSELPGSETGREVGVPEGLDGGDDDGMVGGSPWGGRGGVFGGTGNIPLVETDFDRPPRAIRITQAVYPHDAFIKKIEGTVLLEILIDSEGRVVRARVLSSNPALDAAALETVRGWRFAPALKRGRPVATLAQAPIAFRIF